ncbi:MAG: baseplate J/gp47 family protein [Nitrospirota bacterium]|nr:baseplate J/gp47 family protein [Nitrospirota bacterium]
MAEITKVNGRPVVDYMARDYDSFLRAMREQIPTKLPEWKEFESEADFGNVLLQLFAHMGDILSYYQDRIANESFLGTAQTRRSIIHHLRLIGYRLSTAAPASTELTLLVPHTVNATITIHKGDAFATKSQKDKPSVRFEYTQEEPLVILPSDFSSYAADPTLKAFSPIPVEEGRLIRQEPIGVSDGTPNQTFPLAQPKLILRSLGAGPRVNKDILLLSELGGVIEEWTAQETLAFSREGQKDYLIEIDEDDRATIIFGDGAFGAIPTTGSMLTVTYRVGGGEQGNVAKESIQTIVDAPQLALLAAKISNKDQSATGGSERESIEHAVLHAPNVFRSLRRAVTAEDFKNLALNFPGVGKVRAEATSWNIVTLYVAPTGGGGDVSDVLEANLLAYFEDKRPISTIIAIENVAYVPVYITAQIGVEPYYSDASIIEQVRTHAGSLLDFKHVDFGKTLYLSKFFEAIEAIPGVQFVNITEFRRQSDPVGTSDATGRLLFEPHELPAIPSEPGDADYASGLKVVVE